ncbi:superoxide dismutase family protein [Candidatus Microgenomates bacterium]|nr:superoxide dismutase family protein [Candidatus Microgenomates bacterium]
MQVVVDGKKVVARARAEVEGPSIKGKAEFVEYQAGTQSWVEVHVRLEGNPKQLTPGKHAVHVHEKGDCSGGFKCAGGHFDPGPASNTDPDANHPFHAGDLPNIVIDKQGKGELKAISTRFTVSSGPLSIIDPPEGTALMIHANEDPYKGGESGSGISGGPRIACGIIEKT